MQPAPTPAVEQFHKSSQNDPPVGYIGPLFEINVNYPKPPPVPHHEGGHVQAQDMSTLPPLPGPMVKVEEPWMRVKFEKDPLEYANVVKAYCFEGNVQNDFVVQKNKIRDWYHAPWMHPSPNGREPLKGLTFERPIPQWEFASTQNDALQNWAIGFYNAPGGATFGTVWADPNKPVWNQNIKFHKGTCVYKLLFTTATDDQVPTMKGSPTWQAVISPQPKATEAPINGAERNKFASPVRLIQVDWAVVDERSPIGWVFGTYMYNGELSDTISDPWERLTSVGVMWGNDPQYDEAAFKRGDKLKETWINPEAEVLREKLGGKRPSWGWRGRLNGPADNFISACTSCHGTAQSYTAPLVQDGKLNDKNEWIPRNEKLTMDWFANVKAGETFSVRGALSADYSLQFMIGWNNYQTWLKNQKTPANVIALPGRRVVFKYTEDDEEDEDKKELLRKFMENVSVEAEPLRAGPLMKYT